MKRNEVPKNRKWDLTAMFSNIQEVEETFDKIKKNCDFSKYMGKLNNVDTVLECLTKLNAVVKDLESVCIYAFMLHDEDTSNSESLSLKNKTDMLYIDFSTAVSFITPELSALPIEKLNEFKNDEKLKDFNYTFKKLIDEKNHTLSNETEQVLSMGGQVFDSFNNIFGMLNNADLPFPTMEYEGKEVKVTHGMYGVLLHSEDRKVREEAFKKYYGAFKSVLNTITQIYSGNIYKDVFFAKARKYESCLDKALSNEDVSKEVYANLLNSINEGLPTLHRYIKDRKEILGYDELHMYDIFASLVEDCQIKLDYEDAFKLVKDGLAPLGKEYQELLQKAHDENWIDVEETDNKRSGAYSICAYGHHPYVLLNYQKETNEVFTIAHELGHAMHSYFSHKNQPQEKASYVIFVAEVASTVNEVLLLKYLLKNSEDVKLKKYLCSYYMDMIRTTMFRQTMFAEFEYLAHDAVEKGIPLTTDYLNKIYFDLNQKYYGKDIISDDEIAYEWARIPHFYSAFYVYKYATGIISAITIAERIYNEGETAVKDYFKFLSSGGSDSPVELLKLAGVDLTTKEPFERANKSFEETLKTFENL